MLTSKAKNAIRSFPFLYNLLRPLVLARRSKQAAKELERARQYCSRLPQVVAEPMFVKVGANDGITGDPFSDILLAEAKWKGLLIEPVPYCFNRLRENFHDDRRFALEQMAIGAKAGEATFYYVDEKATESIAGLPSWYDQLGSFDRNHILKHEDGVLEPFIVECKVEVLPLMDMLTRKGIGKVHLLHIDAEGYDYEILKTLDFVRQVPDAIFIEHMHLPAGQKKEMNDLLRKHGYSVRDCGADYFAMHKKAEKQMR